MLRWYTQRLLSSSFLWFILRILLRSSQKGTTKEPMGKFSDKGRICTPSPKRPLMGLLGRIPAAEAHEIAEGTEPFPAARVK